MTKPTGTFKTHDHYANQGGSKHPTQPVKPSVPDGSTVKPKPSTPSAPIGKSK